MTSRTKGGTNRKGRKKPKKQSSRRIKGCKQLGHNAAGGGCNWDTYKLGHLDSGDPDHSRDGTSHLNLSGFGVMYVLCTLAVLTLHNLLKKRTAEEPDGHPEDGGGDAARKTEERRTGGTRRRVQVRGQRPGWRFKVQLPEMNES